MDCIEISSKSTAIADDDVLSGLSVSSSEALKDLDNIHSVNDFSEDDVLSVEPASHNRGDEELRAVGVGSSVGH